MLERMKDWLNELNLDFVKWRYVAAAISTVLVVVSWVLFFAVGPNWGIDFTGGTELHLRFEEPIQINEVRAALKKLDLPEDSVQRVGTDDERPEFRVRIQDAAFGAEEARAEVEQMLVAKFGPDWIEQTRFDAEVGARLVVVYQGDPVTPQAVGEAVDAIEGATVQAGRTDNEVVIALPGLARQIEREIHEAMGEADFEVLSIDAVGPKVGAELRRAAAVAIAATLFLVLIYVAFRFDLAFAPGAILALFHDVSVTIGIFILLDKEFSLPLIGALLTIVGYSLNDTIVIYDRIRENLDKYRRKQIADVINLSVNETLTRTISTSGSTLLAISPFLIIGGPVVGDFAFAMLCGIVFGTYSTVYVASPMILVMEEVKPHLQRLIAGGKAPPAGGSGDGDGGEPGDQRPLTESEKRRRERAEREKAERSGGGVPDPGR